MMDYNLILSLEDMAAVRVVLSMWNRVDTSILTSPVDAKCRLLNFSVIDKIKKLPLPKQITMKLSGISKPIGLRILRWLIKYKRILLDHPELSIKYLMSIICLTSKGTIDEGKTAMILVKNEHLEINLRFRLACMYCMEEYIYTLWEKLDDRKFYKNDLYLIFRHEPCLVSFWVHYIKGKLAKLNISSPYKYGFLFAICQYYSYPGKNNDIFLYNSVPNEVAARYFLRKLTLEEKPGLELVLAAEIAAGNACSCYPDTDREQNADILFFLLSIMTYEEQKELFKICAYKVLKCLLYWPWQIFFIETAERILYLQSLNFSELEYYYIINDIIDVSLEVYPVYNYKELLGMLWQQSPSHYKKYVIELLPVKSLLFKLFQTEDKQNIFMILKAATMEEREFIIFSGGINICKQLLYREMWDLLKFFIEICIPSKDKIIKFKNKFKYYYENNLDKERPHRSKWIEFSQLLDQLIGKYEEV